jgi:hypothetical protein
MVRVIFFVFPGGPDSHSFRWVFLIFVPQQDLTNLFSFSCCALDPFVLTALFSSPGPPTAGETRTSQNVHTRRTTSLPKRRMPKLQPPTVEKAKPLKS